MGRLESSISARKTSTIPDHEDVDGKGTNNGAGKKDPTKNQVVGGSQPTRTVDPPDVNWPVFIIPAFLSSVLHCGRYWRPITHCPC